MPYRTMDEAKKAPVLLARRREPPPTTASHYDRAAGSQALQGQSTSPAASERSHRGSSCVVVGSRLLDTLRVEPSCGRNGRGWFSPPLGGVGRRAGKAAVGRGNPPLLPPLEPAAYGTGDGGAAEGARREGTPRGDSRPPPRPLPSRFGLVGEGVPP